jgi:hypothetical protein
MMRSRVRRQRPREARGALIAGVLSSVLLCAGAAEAQDPSAAQKQACIDAHVSAQRLRRDGRLLDARAALVTCAVAACPGIVVSECSALLAEVERGIPSVVIGAVDAAGRDAIAVRVHVDGKLVASRLDGKPVPLDPGEHVFRYEMEGAPAVEERLLVREGERARAVVVRFTGPDARRDTPAPGRGAEESRPIPALAFVLGGVGLLGGAAFGVFSGIGLSQKGDLDDLGCKPGCAEEDVDDVRRSFLIGDIALATGVVAVGAAVVVYLTRPSVRAETAGLLHPRGVVRRDGAGLGFSF